MPCGFVEYLVTLSPLRTTKRWKHSYITSPSGYGAGCRGAGGESPNSACVRSFCINCSNRFNGLGPGVGFVGAVESGSTPGGGGGSGGGGGGGGDGSGGLCRGLVDMDGIISTTSIGTLSGRRIMYKWYIDTSQKGSGLIMRNGCRNTYAGMSLNAFQYLPEEDLTSATV